MAKYVVTLNGKNYEVEVEKNTAKITNTTAAAAPAAAPAPKAAPAPAPVAAPAPAAAPAPVAAAPAGGANVTAPMPGTVLNVVAPVGTAVKAGDVILILEAMKMENDIVAAMVPLLPSLPRALLLTPMMFLLLFLDRGRIY